MNLFLNSWIAHIPASTGTAGQPSLQALSLITSEALLSVLSYTTGTPGFKIPAFSAAIFSMVSPKISVWSRLTEVRTVIIGEEILFVASRRPPRPVSKTTYSTSALQNNNIPIAKINSKNVGCPKFFCSK
ncbi:Uncharacterised protein [uncultured Roseburia sp.]|nr:Uncharacterised protein [uncultured Roseburia sp.]